MLRVFLQGHEEDYLDLDHHHEVWESQVDPFVPDMAFELLSEAMAWRTACLPSPL